MCRETFFLDNEDKFDYVMRQLRQTEAIARKTGMRWLSDIPKNKLTMRLNLASDFKKPQPAPGAFERNRQSA